MSQLEIVAKLSAFLNAHSPVTEECHVVYLMVELRKVLDHTESASRYPALKFYADWTVHTRKDRLTREMIRTIEAICDEAVREIENPDELARRASLREFAYMSALRRDMAAVFQEHGIGDTLTSSKDNWLAFVVRLVKVLENQPIVIPDGLAATVCFEPAAENCVIGRINFREPINGFTHYDYMNAY